MVLGVVAVATMVTVLRAQEGVIVANEPTVAAEPLVVTVRWEPSEGEPVFVRVQTRKEIRISSKLSSGDGLVHHGLEVSGSVLPEGSNGPVLIVLDDILYQKRTRYEVEQAENSRGPRQFEYFDGGVQARTSLVLERGQETTVIENPEGKLVVGVLDAQSSPARE